MRPGIYRRRIRIATAPGWARADLEDDPHRCGVEIRHNGQSVSSVQGFPIRLPWSLCTSAVKALSRLIGMPLSPNPQAVYRFTSYAEQCIHMFDIAGLAVAHAARGIRRCQYDVVAPISDKSDRRRISLHRNGELILNWTVAGTVEKSTILEPTPFAGRNVKYLPGWARTAFEDMDDFEAVVVLRRAVYISLGSRSVDLDEIPYAAAAPMMNWLIGSCYVFQPETANRALRVAGSTFDFAKNPEDMLSDLAGEKE